MHTHNWLVGSAPVGMSRQVRMKSHPCTARQLHPHQQPALVGPLPMRTQHSRARVRVRVCLPPVRTTPCAASACAHTCNAAARLGGGVMWGGGLGGGAAVVGPAAGACWAEAEG